MQACAKNVNHMIILTLDLRSPKSQYFFETVMTILLNHLEYFPCMYFFFFFFGDVGIPMVLHETRLFPWEHAHRNTCALGKSGVSVEHTMWGANPHIIPLNHHPSKGARVCIYIHTRTCIHENGLMSYIAHWTTVGNSPCGAHQHLRFKILVDMKRIARDQYAILIKLGINPYPSYRLITLAMMAVTTMMTAKLILSF